MSPAPGRSRVESGAGREERIQKILSKHGVASRRAAEAMILSGRVTVNGVTAELGQSAAPPRDIVAVDGVPIGQSVEFVYIMLNKPRGYITTVSDERGRKTVMELVKESGTRVYPVGRLDKDTEGLLLLTNDGRFANSVAHPSNSKNKTYEIRFLGDAAGAAEAMRRPMDIDSRTVRALAVRLVKQSENGGVLRVVVGEGRNRQLRKMCSLCGLFVVSLKRVSVGALELGPLKTGTWRYLTEKEVSYFG